MKTKNSLPHLSRFALLAVALLLSFGTPMGCTSESPNSDPGKPPANSEKTVTDTQKAAPPAGSETAAPENASSTTQTTAQKPSDAPGVVIGRVTDLSGPMVGLVVQLQGLELIQAKTNAEGEFTLNDVPPGDYVVQVVDMEAIASGLMRIKSRGTSVGPGQLVEENFELGTGFSVFGKVSGLTVEPNRALVTVLRAGAPDLTGTQLGDQLLQFELQKHVEGSDFVDKEFTYEVIDVPTGTYELRLQIMPDPQSSRSDPWPAPAIRMTIEVGDKDLEENLELKK